MAMIAQEATDITIRITSSVLPTASLWAMKWPKPSVGGQRVHGHFSSSKSTGT